MRRVVRKLPPQADPSTCGALPPSPRCASTHPPEPHSPSHTLLPACWPAPCPETWIRCAAAGSPGRRAHPRLRPAAPRTARRWCPLTAGCRVPPLLEANIGWEQPRGSLARAGVRQRSTGTPQDLQQTLCACAPHPHGWTAAPPGRPPAAGLASAACPSLLWSLSVARLPPPAAGHSSAAPAGQGRGHAGRAAEQKGGPSLPPTKALTAQPASCSALPSRPATYAATHHDLHTHLRCCTQRAQLPEEDVAGLL